MSYIATERLDGLLIVRLDDAPRRNVLSAPLCRELSDAMSRAAEDSHIRAIIITGTDPAFCAGADLKDLEAAAHGQRGPLGAVYQSFMDVAMSPLLTLAAINGAAVGAGLNLALACDLRIAGESAVFDTRFLELGLHPGGGHAWMLLRAVGWAHASRMLLAGQPLGAEEAKRVGLVEELVPSSQLMGRAVELLRIPAAASRELVMRTKATMRLAVHSSHETALVHETSEQGWSLGHARLRKNVHRFGRDIEPNDMEEP